jgi:hypothetical protein
MTLKTGVSYDKNLISALLFPARQDNIPAERDVNLGRGLPPPMRCQATVE